MPFKLNPEGTRSEMQLADALGEISSAIRVLPESIRLFQGLNMHKATIISQISWSSKHNAHLLWGSFGNHAVALMRIFTLSSVPQEVQGFLWKCASIWERLVHENILPFHGVYIPVDHLVLIYDWGHNGNILQYLKSDPNASRLKLSWMQDIVTKINILLQEICDIKLQKQRNNILNVHKNHPKGTDEENGLDDIHWIYNNASSHPPHDIPSNPGHHAPDPNHVPNIDDNAFVQQKQAPYKLWSALPPESLLSSSSDEDLTDDNADCTGVEFGLGAG